MKEPTMQERIASAIAAMDAGEENDAYLILVRALEVLRKQEAAQSAE